MKPAFSFLTPLPPPRPQIIARHDRLRAVSTADTRIVLVVQRVVRHFIDLDICPYVGPGPPDEGIHFHELKGVVPLDRLGVGSSRRLLPSDARDPRLITVEDTSKRLNFPQLAAAIRIAGPQGFAMLLRLLFRRQQRFHLMQLSGLQLISLNEAVTCGIGLSKEKICIEIE